MRMPNCGQHHPLAVDALVGVLGDEQVVRVLAGQRPQELPVRGAEVLALVHEHVIGDVLARHVSDPPQVDRGDGRRLGEVDGPGDARLGPVGLDDVPDRGPLGPVQGHAAPGPPHLEVRLPAGDPVRQDDLGVLGREELRAAQCGRQRRRPRRPARPARRCPACGRSPVSWPRRGRPPRRRRHPLRPAAGPRSPARRSRTRRRRARPGRRPWAAPGSRRSRSVRS